MGFDTSALIAIHVAGILGAVIGAWRGAPVWKAALVAAAFMAAGFLLPVQRSSFSAVEYWVGSVFLVSLVAAGLVARLLRVPLLIFARIVFVTTIAMSLTAAGLA